MTAVNETRFWQAVEEARIRSGSRNLQELAKKLDLIPTYFSQLRIRGNDPKADILRAIALKANISTDWMLGLTNIRERRWSS